MSLLAAKVIVYVFVIKLLIFTRFHSITRILLEGLCSIYCQIYTITYTFTVTQIQHPYLQKCVKTFEISKMA